MFLSGEKGQCSSYSWNQTTVALTVRIRCGYIGCYCSALDHFLLIVQLVLDLTLK